MEFFEKGKLVWFDPGLGYNVPGEIVEENRLHKSVIIQSNFSGKNHVYELKHLNKISARTEMPENGVDDMICLSDLTEGSLLWNLKIRYEKNQIYTYTGSILVAVNPYKMFDIYNLDMVKKYESHVLGSLPPHLFAIGSSAYSKMMKDTMDQVIVISGESGAGKTESTKLLMQYLAAVNRAPSNTITEQILEANPLLESFGNAKTTRNDNSSRFGKYLEVYFKDGLIIGAKISEYLLEKSRIVSQASDERNYHVFYEMLMGLTEEQKQKYGLIDANKYFYLNQGGNARIEHKDDGEDFHALIAAFDILGFTKHEQDTIIKILASVLHIGNVYFIRKQDKNYQDTVEIGSDAEIKWTSYLLGINDQILRQKLTFKITEARDEKVLTPLNIDQALDARDAIAKALYSRLFTWLVERINNIICRTMDKQNSIAILDIFGFENFATNGFEQLCINYANEALQFYFNKHIFRLEQEEYAKEKISWKNIEYSDNRPCIDLISKKPNGIIHIIDDESSFPKTTDFSLLEKLHFVHSSNQLYGKPRMSTPEFIIKHYAGEVMYEVRNFLDKNRDLLRTDVIDMFINSRNTQIAKMFRELRGNFEHQRSMSKTGKFVTMKPKTPTVAAKFHDSLSNLLDAMSRCNPLFVRCIKPNNKKAPMNFEMKVVLEQLCYTGMLETIRIRKLGYPIRYKFNYFINRYRPLLGKIPSHLETSKELSIYLLAKLDSVYKYQYQIGLNKVFLRENLDQHLEQKRILITRKAAIIIQKYIRTYVARRKFIKLREDVVTIQKNVKMWIQRARYRKIRNGFIKAQAQFRMMRQRKRYLRMKDDIKRKQQYLAHEPEMNKKHYNYDSGKQQVSFNLLDIPPELAFIYSKLDDWEDSHLDRNITISTSQVNTLANNFELPSDINSFTFNKFIQIYIKDGWDRVLTPLSKPFLSKLSLIDVQESLAIFKMILRCVNSNEYDSKRDKVLIDYIMQKGLMNVNLRDEIFIQIINQTWNNNDKASNRKSWELMACCLSAFPPSPYLYKYLLKYASDHATDAYKAYCQKKLLQCENIESQLARTYPPSQLEWRATTRCANLALEANFADLENTVTQLESWTTGEEFARDSLKGRGIDDYELDGWTVTLHDDNDWYELMGNDYVLDLISEMEVPPAFPVCKSFFLVSTDSTKETGNQQKRRSMTAGSNNPDSVYDWYFEMQQTANSTDRLVLPKAIKGNSSNRNLSELAAPHPVNDTKSALKQYQNNNSALTASAVSNSRISQPLISNSKSALNSQIKAQKQQPKPIIKSPPPIVHMAAAPAAVKKPSVKLLESKSKTSIGQIKSHVNAAASVITPRNSTDVNNKSLSRKRLAKSKAFNADLKATRMFTLNKSKKGTICSARKQNFRFRFEPNKSTLTKICLKDSVKIQAQPPPPPQQQQHHYSNTCSPEVNDEPKKSDAKKVVISKQQNVQQVKKQFEDKAYSSQIYDTHMHDDDAHSNDGKIVAKQHKVVRSENPKQDIKTKIAELTSQIRAEENRVLSERKERVTLSKVSKLNSRYIKKATNKPSEIKGNPIANKIVKGNSKNLNDSSMSTFSNLKSNSSALLSRSSALNERYLKNVDLNKSASRLGTESMVFSDVSEANTIKKIPIPNSKSDVEAFLDDIFDRALDVNLKKRNMRLKALQKRIKGGGNSATAAANEEEIVNLANDVINYEDNPIRKFLNELENSQDEESEWSKSEDQNRVSLLHSLNYVTAGDRFSSIIPNQDYEYSKLLRIFLKDKKNILKISEDHDEAKDKTIFTFREKTNLMPYPKLWISEKSNTMRSTFPVLKQQAITAKEDFYDESLALHQSLFQNNWDLLLNVYNFCKYESDSTKSGSLNTASSIISSLSNSGYSSIGSACSTNYTNLNRSFTSSWSSFGLESVKSNEELKMYVDSIGLTVNREIIIKGSLSDKIKGGLEKPEAIDIPSRKHMYSKQQPLFGYFQVDQDMNANKLAMDNSGAVPIMSYSPPVIPFVDPNQVALMQAVYTQLAQQQQFLLNQKDGGKQNPCMMKNPSQNDLRCFEQKIEMTPVKPLNNKEYETQMIVENPISSSSNSQSSNNSINTYNGDTTTHDSDWRVNPYNGTIPPAPPLPPPPPPLPRLKATLSDLQGRAKTVRIGKVRWPPPLKEKETFEKELARRLELQRKIQEEILTAAEKLGTNGNPAELAKLHSSKLMELKRQEDDHANAIKRIEDKIRCFEDANAEKCLNLNLSEPLPPIPNAIMMQKAKNIAQMITETKLQQIFLKRDQNRETPPLPPPASITFLANFQASQESDGTKVDCIATQSITCASATATIQQQQQQQQNFMFDATATTDIHRRSTHQIAAYSPVIPSSPLPAYPPIPESASSKQRMVTYEENVIETKLHEQINSQTYVYTKIQWSLHIRKEVFSPTEKLETPIAIDLIFLQIVKDFKATHCIRLSDVDRLQLKNFLDSKSLTASLVTQQVENIKVNVKRQIIEIAKDWPLYFSRLFPVAGSKQYGNVQILGISHSGIRLIKRERSPNQDVLVSIEHYSLWDVREVVVPKGSTIHLIVNRNDKKITLYSHRANQIKKMIDSYCAELDQESKFVQALRDYITNEDSSLLSFRKGDIIKLLHKSYTPHGWLRGILNGRKGVFPVEYVRQIARSELYDFNKNTETFGGGPDQTGEKPYPPLTTILDDMNDECQSPTNLTNQDGNFSMMEFAMMNFRQSIDKYTVIDKIKAPVLHGSSNVLQKLRDSRLSSANARDWNWSDYAQMVKFSKSPIAASLLKFDKQELSQMAVNCFIEIMRFMGDYPLAKGQKDIDCIYFLLQTLHHHSELCDEVYCQLMKQTTNNKSTKTDSCQKGWRLMAIISAYFKTSELLKPYLLKYLENNAYDTKRPYNAIAQICLTSLRKTFKYGGRRNVPSQIELDALITGRISKRQMFLLPGGVPILLNIRSCTVVQDCIEQICGHLAVQNPLEQYEFAIYYVVEAEKAARPLNRCEYIFDVITELTKLNNEFYLIFKRILWHFPLRLESDGYIDMMYNQILPDYAEGLVVITHMSKLSTNQNNDIALIAALQYRANDKVGLPSMREVKHLLPANVLDLKDLKPQQWVTMIHLKLRQIEHFTVTQAKTKFLEVLQSWPLFGSTFFYVKNIYDSRIHGDCIMAINKHGVHFLNKESHESILSFTFNEVISTRRYRGENNLQFVDLKCGNLMVQKVTRIETDQGNEISILIGQYIDLLNRYQENYKQYGPYNSQTTVYNGQDITTTFL